MSPLSSSFQPQASEESGSPPLTNSDGFADPPGLGWCVGSGVAAFGEDSGIGAGSGSGIASSSKPQLSSSAANESPGSGSRLSSSPQALSLTSDIYSTPFAPPAT